MVSIWHNRVWPGDVTFVRYTRLRLSHNHFPVLPVWRGVWSQVTRLARMLLDVLPDVCGEWCCLDLWAGRTCRSSLSQSPWDHHTFNWTGSANQREVSWSPSVSLKAGGSSAQTDSAGGSNQGGLFIFFSCLLLALKIFYHVSVPRMIYIYMYMYITLLCACGHFQKNRKMSSTVTCAAVLLACALTFAAAQCEFHECDIRFSCGNTFVVVLIWQKVPFN